MSIDQTLTRIIAARAALVLDQPFFGSLALQLRLEIDPTCRTAWTNGRSIGFNPQYVATLTKEQLVALIAHEVLHCALGHPWRRDGREPKQWNKACDYAINPIIKDAGFTLPENVLLSDEYAGHHAEWIFDRCGGQDEPDDNGKPDDTQNGTDPQDGGQDDPQNGQNGAQNDDWEDSKGQGSDGEVRDAPADSQGEMNEAEWKEIEKQARQLSRGSLSAGVAREMAHQQAPIVDWRAALRRFLQSTTPTDYSWTKPNQRYVASGLYLPALRTESMGILIIAVDTSGSIDKVTLAQFGAELQSIASEMQPTAIHVVYCDYDITDSQELAPNEPIVLAPKGGGGTRFSPVFDWVESEGIQPAALVYFTDLDGDTDFPAPAYPVLWACTMGDRAVPFGEVLPLND